MSMSDGTPAAIAAVNEQFQNAFNTKDASGMGQHYTEDGQVLPPNGPTITGPGAIADFWAAVMGMGIDNVRLETVEFEDHGSTAIEIGNFFLSRADGQPIDNGTYLVVWKNDGGTWKLHRDIWNSDTPAS
jgi:uncharacterized protein (TIGR02246 family)